LRTHPPLLRDPIGDRPEPGLYLPAASPARVTSLQPIREERTIDVEQSSAGIDALIERRAQERAAANELEEMWAASARRHNARLEAERLWDRLRYHQAMLEAHSQNFETLLKRHRAGLRLCEEALGIVGAEGKGA
jgi:hypothetical protein